MFEVDGKKKKKPVKKHSTKKTIMLYCFPISSKEKKTSFRVGILILLLFLNPQKESPK